MSRLTTRQKEKKLQEIAQKVEHLKQSPLYAFRVENNYHPVSGEGDPDAQIMFIGEAPGKNEAIQGRPFIGAAGKFLESLFASIHMQREDVFITSVLKDRPPKNRDPRPEEISLYTPFLDEQIEIIQPKVLVALGRYSLQYLLNKFHLPEAGKTITQLHGKKLKATADYGEVIVLPLYHPAVALYSRRFQDVMMSDFAQLKNFSTFH